MIYTSFPSVEHLLDRIELSINVMGKKQVYQEGVCIILSVV